MTFAGSFSAECHSFGLATGTPSGSLPRAVDTCVRCGRSVRVSRVVSFSTRRWRRRNVTWEGVGGLEMAGRDGMEKVVERFVQLK